MPVPTFLHVDWMRKTNFILVWDVANLGAGHVGRNIVVSILTPRQGNGFLLQKTIMMALVVEKKMDLRKRTIVEVAVQVTAPSDGKLSQEIVLGLQSLVASGFARQGTGAMCNSLPGVAFHWLTTSESD